MKTRKLNLKEFQKETLEVEKLLEAKGGSGGITNSWKCRTRSYEGDHDSTNCDTDF